MAGNPATPVVLLRARPQSEAFAARLTERFGTRLRPVIAPLLEIVPVPGDIDPQSAQTLIFTSVHAVAEFAARSRRRDIPALCVGERTCEAALATGMAARSAGGNADDLVRLALAERPRRAGGYFYLRGHHTTGNLAERLAEAGQVCREQIVYDQQALPLAAAARAAISGGEGAVVPLFSARTAALFARSAKGLDLGSARAICLSANVAACVENAGFSEVRVVAKPTADAIVQEIAAII